MAKALRGNRLGLTPMGLYLMATVIAFAPGCSQDSHQGLESLSQASPDNQENPQGPLENSSDPLLSLYDRAVNDAKKRIPSKIKKNLVPLHQGNSLLVKRDKGLKIKVVTWKSSGSYQKNIAPHSRTGDQPNHMLWVTVAPMIQNFCKGYRKTHPTITPERLDLRLKQRLGLHPSWNYDLFVEMWVAAEDLFRPCADPETTDSSCELRPRSEKTSVKNIPDYNAYFNQLYEKSFASTPQVPWTGFGYTYDWSASDGNVVGESEFILSPQSAYEVAGTYKTMDYCSP